MNTHRPVSAYLFVSATMFIVGAMMAETGAAMSRITAQLGIDAVQQGYLVSARFAGGVVLGVLLWLGSARIALRLIYRGAMATVALTGLLLFVPGYASALLIALLRGLAVGALIPLSGVYAANQTEHPAGPVTATVNATLSAGLVLHSLIAMGLSQWSGVAWELYWTLPSVLAAVLYLVGGAVVFPVVDEKHTDPGYAAGSPAVSGSELSAQAPPGSAAPSPVMTAFRRTDWIIAITAAFTVSAESVLIGLIPYRTGLIDSVRMGGEPVALFLMVGILAGRILGRRWLAAMDARRLFNLTIVSLVGFSVLWIGGAAFGSFSQVVARIVFLALVTGLGLSSATIFPALVSYSAQRGRAVATTTIAAIGWTAGIGGTVMPAIAGVASDRGLPGELFPVFVAAPVLVAIALIAWHARRLRRSPNP